MHVLAAARQALNARRRSLRAAALGEIVHLLPRQDAGALSEATEHAMSDLREAAIACLDAQGAVDVMRFQCYGAPASQQDEAIEAYHATLPGRAARLAALREARAEFEAVHDAALAAGEASLIAGMEVIDELGTAVPAVTTEEQRRIDHLNDIESMWPAAAERAATRTATEATLQAISWIEEASIAMGDSPGGDWQRYLRIWVEFTDRVAARGAALEMQAAAERRSAEEASQIMRLLDQEIETADASVR